MAWVPWFIRERRDRQRDEELRVHLAHHVEDLIGRGVAPDDARRQARLLLGNPRVTREEVDTMQTLPWMDILIRDVRYAGRMLRRTPGFTLTAVATLALVIGANTAVFSLANGLLFAPLPYPAPDELHLLQADIRSPRGDFSGTGVDGHTWRALQATPWSTRSAVFTNWASGVNLAIDGQAMFVDQQRVGAGFFRTLGVEPHIGREFLPDEDVPGGPGVVVLSHHLWQRLFQGAAEVIGRTILLRGEPWQIVGVMPEHFRSTADADLWTPLRPSTAGEGGGTNYAILLRVPEDVPRDDAAAQLRPTLDPSLRERGLRDDTTATVSLLSLKESMALNSREVIVMFGAAAVLVLLIACANLAALLLARGGARSREVATRMALGSGRFAVVRQLMVESLVLALIGGAAGLVVGWFGLAGLQALAGDRFSDWQRVTMDGRVLGVSAALSVLTSVLFGLVPAWQASRLNVQAALVEGGSRAVAGGAKHWTRRGLVVLEVALGVVLLVSAGLLVRTFANLQSIDPGFRAEGLTTASVSLLDARYPGPDEIIPLFERTLELLRATPGVESAAVSLGLPFERVLNMGFQFPGAESGQIASVMYASAGFFDTLGIETRRGRVFEPRDTRSGRPVVVVNEAFAQFYSRDEEVVGRVLRTAGVEREVVGVVANVQQRPGFLITGMIPGPLVSAPLIYVPSAQLNEGLASTHVWFGPAFTVRATTPAIGERALMAAIAGADPLLPLGAVRQMSQVRAGAIAMQEMLMILIGTLAVVALLLTALGLHGVIAHSVVERTREFGIRIALGASPGATVRAVTLNGVILAAIGVVIGVALAVPASALVASSLYGVAERDVVTYAAAAGFLLLVAAVASLLPALRLLSLDPAVTLRR
jgi:predicted permease